MSNGQKEKSSRDRLWSVYLAGEIHSTWRSQIRETCQAKSLPIEFIGPELDHDVSDMCGEQILGPESKPFWHDHKAAKINAIRNQVLLKDSDILVVRFGEKYRQWNAAFDAGMAIAFNIPVITFHDESLDHALKEIDGQAMAVTRTVDQIVGILHHVTKM